MVGRTVGRKPNDCIEMVYEYLSAGFVHPLTYSRVTECEPPGIVASLKLLDYVAFPPETPENPFTTGTFIKLANLMVLRKSSSASCASAFNGEIGLL